MTPGPTPELPTGTVTLLFTDIEESTRLTDHFPHEMARLLVRHNALLEQSIRRHEGVVFKTLGDGYCAAFADASRALLAILEAQQALRAEDWSPLEPLRVRAALHTCEIEPLQGDYVGSPVNRVARIRDAAHGGQTLLSKATFHLVQDTLPPGVTLQPLGLFQLRGLQRPETLYQLQSPELPSAFPYLRAPNLLSQNLPLQLTRFIGREEECVEVKALLTTTRLLTLIGTSGCGKTRLALQVAAELPVAYSDGIRFVDLAPLTDPSLVLQSIASVLEVKEERGRPLIQTLIESLSAKSLLILLDNCEHLIEACADLVNILLHACPNLCFLTTSREPLEVSGEVCWYVPPLGVPPHGTQKPEGMLHWAAIRLFVDRAQAALPSFILTETNGPTIARICARLDGIPLALELAASRVKGIPLERIAQGLEQGFRLLQGGSRTALPRHQTMQAAIDWSYDLLTEPERRLLLRLSVFAGGWRLEDAEAVCQSTNPAEDETEASRRDKKCLGTWIFQT